jgi:hypothetical protein
MSADWFDPPGHLNYPHRSMKRGATLLGCMCLVFVAACPAANSSPPTPMSLGIPPPPEAQPGSIRIYGDHLPPERAEHIREKLRSAEPELFGEYQAHLAEFQGEEGRVQIRLGIGRDGKVTDVARVYSETGKALDLRLRPVLEGLDFGAGPEAWVYYTLEFRRDPLEVLQISTDFAQATPVLVALVENRSAFHFGRVSATVTVLGPEKSKPLRVYRRRISADFPPGERRELRVPVGGEWATARNSFLVTIRPVRTRKAETDEKDGESEKGEPGVAP